MQGGPEKILLKTIDSFVEVTINFNACCNVYKHVSSKGLKVNMCIVCLE